MTTCRWCGSGPGAHLGGRICRTKEEAEMCGQRVDESNNEQPNDNLRALYKRGRETMTAAPDADVVETVKEIIADGCGCDRNCKELVGADVFCGCETDAQKIIELVRAIAEPARPAPDADVVEALLDATAHLAGAVSAYEKYAGNSERRSIRDPFFKTRLSDFQKAVTRAQTALARFEARPAPSTGTDLREELAQALANDDDDIPWALANDIRRGQYRNRTDAFLPIIAAHTASITVERDRWRDLEKQAATHIESVICMRTHFTGEEPYVGWKGLGLALTEALDKRDDLAAERDCLLEQLAGHEPTTVEGDMQEVMRINNALLAELEAARKALREIIDMADESLSADYDVIRRVNRIAMRARAELGRHEAPTTTRAELERTTRIVRTTIRDLVAVLGIVRRNTKIPPNVVKHIDDAIARAALAITRVEPEALTKQVEALNGRRDVDIAAEREACAQIAEIYCGSNTIAQRIRARAALTATPNDGGERG